MSANTIYSQTAASGAAVGASFRVNRTDITTTDIVQDLAWTVSGTCSFKIQTSWDEVTWVDVGSALTATGSAAAQTLRTFIRVNVASATTATITVTCTYANTNTIRDSKVAAALAFLVQPVTTADGALMTAFTVCTVDEDGIQTSARDVLITVVVKAGTTSVVSGTLSVLTDQNGVAVFDGVTVDTPDTGNVLTASAVAAGLTAVDSSTFDVTA